MSMPKPDPSSNGKIAHEDRQNKAKSLANLYLFVLLLGYKLKCGKNKAKKSNKKRKNLY